MGIGPRTYYVIGYPKSGNTWLARMLADLTGGRIAADDPVNAAVIGAAGSEGTVIVKAHHERTTAPSDVRSSRSVVYVVRDLRDVVISAFFYTHPRVQERWVAKGAGLRWLPVRLYFIFNARLQIGSWGGTVISRIRRAVFSSNQGHRVGAWRTHVESWRGAPGVAFVRYEDLLDNCAGEMRRITASLGIEVGEALLDEVIKRHTFGSVKRLFEERRDDINVKFLRAGRAGDWERFLNPYLLAVIRRRHGAVMERLGYKLTDAPQGQTAPGTGGERLDKHE